MRDITRSVNSISPFFKEKICQVKQGDFGYIRVIIDFNAWVNVLGSGEFIIQVIRPGLEETRENVEILPVTIEESKAFWVLALEDTEVPGMGTLQCVYNADNGSIKKSPIFCYEVTEK